MSSFSATIPKDSVYYAKRWRGLLFIGISVIALSLNNGILNVALPAIGRGLNAGSSDLQWIIDSYVLVFAALLLTFGTLGDRYGRKRALQGGLALFAVGSLIAALSSSTGMLIGARMFQGVAAALVLPATLSIISATFQPDERPQAIATWASLFGLGVGIGPVVGGFLVQTFGWHAVFLSNLPVIAIALIGGHFFLGETREPNTPPLDIVGSLLSIAGLFALVFAIIEAGALGWGDQTVVLSLVGAVILLALFVAWEARTPYPMLPLRFFRNPAFTGANITLTLLSFSLFGVVFFVPQYLQSVLGYPAFIAGLQILPLAIVLTFMTSRSARVAERLGTKRTVAFGVGLTGVAFLYMALVYDLHTAYFPWIFIGQILQASGIGLAISPATTAVMSSVPVEKAGVGSAMNDTTRQLGGALGVAILGTIATGLYVGGVAPLQSVIAPEAYAQVAAGLQTALSPTTQALIDPALTASVTHTAKSAFMAGMSQAFLVAAIVNFVSALFALRLLPDVVQGRGLRRSAQRRKQAGPVIQKAALPAEGQD